MKIKQGDFVAWQDTSYTKTEDYKGDVLMDEVNGLVLIAIFERFYSGSYDKNIIPTCVVRSTALTVIAKTEHK